MAGNYRRISKSQYIKGIQCPKALWYYRNRRDLKPEISEVRQHLFDTGHEIGELAHSYFGRGIEITEEYYQIDRAIKSTEKTIQQGHEIIFEATACSADGAFSRIDVLNKVPGSDAWDLIEVKSSTGVKEYHIEDMALQRYAFEGAGYNIRKSILMHVNNNYIRSGELDLRQLFMLEDCTELVTEKMQGIGQKVKMFLDLLASKTEPEIGIGDHCYTPFECDYIPHCWKHVPAYSVYDIFQGRKLEDLLSSKILDVAGIPEDFETTERQYVDITSYKTNQVHVNKEAIQRFLNSLTYPLYYLDYETVSPAVPLFDNSRPYQQVPFQFSLHIQDRKGGDLKHFEFLHAGKNDPRPDFINALIAGCGTQGSVVVYNQGFESRINNELSGDFPNEAEQLNRITERMADLLIPFRSRYLYHPKMRGSASLKNVVPAFVPNMSYDDLAIGDGDTASMVYLSCIKGQVPEDEKEKIYQDLKVYCRQDTLAETKLLGVLYEYS